jgi:hypothetical protein
MRALWSKRREVLLRLVALDAAGVEEFLTGPASGGDADAADARFAGGLGVVGCLAWQREGLCPPSAVLDATEDYFTTQDTLGTWLEEKTIDDKQAKTSSSELYNSFKIWCETGAEYAPSQRDFSQKLGDRGFVKHKSDGSIAFRGLRLPTQKEAIKSAAKVLKFAKA